MTRSVYVDILFLVNFAANWCLISAAGNLVRRKAPARRALLCSALGAAYATGVFLPGTALLYSWPVRLLAGLAMVKGAFPGVRGRSLLSLLVSFYLCCGVAGGTALAAYSLVGSLDPGFTRQLPGRPLAIPWWTPLVGLVSAAAIPILLALSWQKPGAPLLQVELELDGKSVVLTGLLDTGNDLRDPLSGLPVIVVDLESLKGILPVESLAFLTAEWDKLGDDAALTPLARRFRLIPYRGVSGKHGVLPGFVPDRVVLGKRSGSGSPAAAVVGVTWERLSPSGAYQALVHPDLV